MYTLVMREVRSRAGFLALCLTGFIVTGACTQMRESTLPPAEIELQALTDSIWLHTSYYTYPGGTRFPSNGLIIKDGDSLTLIDTAWGELATVALLAEIEEKIGLSVSSAYITHSHGDRIAGADVLESRGVRVYAHPMTRRLAIESGLAVPDGVLDELAPGDTVRVGRLEIYYPGPAHTSDNLVVWIGDERLLFGGCAVRAAASGSAGNLVDADLDAWIEAISAMQSRYAGAEVVVPGHGEPGGKALLQHTARLVRAAGKP